MASHAGMEYVLRTKYGYVDEKGEFTEDRSKALNIDFMRFGFGPSAYEVYKRLGFDISKISSKDIYFAVTKPSYDSRLGSIESILRELGYDYRQSCEMAEMAFSRFQLQYYNNFEIYMERLNEELKKFYERREVDEVISVDDKRIKLWKVDESSNLESSTKNFYSQDGKIMKYSFRLKKLDISRYFDVDDSEVEYYQLLQNEDILEYLMREIELNRFDLRLDDSFEVVRFGIEEDELTIYFKGYNYNLTKFCNEKIRSFYSDREMHITRIFGSYVLLRKINGELQAVKATPIPIKYCPLMIKLLREVGGEAASSLIETLKVEDEKKQCEAMCRLINQVVIKGGYFDTNRPLNSCEANVLFGASETMSSAFKNDMIDAAVIVSNNLGTIITTNSSNTQGAVKRMTGLFYTTPSKEIVETAIDANIIPVFPYTGKIDQLAGVREAIRLGYKRIAVSVAAGDNYLHKEIKELEKDGVKIYKFGLCSTGISEDIAHVMRDNADVIWSCASKYVKEVIEPEAIAQVGVKIPVHVMTRDGWEIVRNHLNEMNNSYNEEEITLCTGEEKPVYLNQNGDIKVLKKKNLKKCEDCPSPCI